MSKKKISAYDQFLEKWNAPAPQPPPKCRSIEEVLKNNESLLKSGEWLAEGARLWGIAMEDFPKDKNE